MSPLWGDACVKVQIGRVVGRLSLCFFILCSTAVSLAAPCTHCQLRERGVCCGGNREHVCSHLCPPPPALHHLASSMHLCEGSCTAPAVGRGHGSGCKLGPDELCISLAFLWAASSGTGSQGLDRESGSHPLAMPDSSWSRDTGDAVSMGSLGHSTMKFMVWGDHGCSREPFAWDSLALHSVLACPWKPDQTQFLKGVSSGLLDSKTQPLVS